MQLTVQVNTSDPNQDMRTEQTILYSDYTLVPSYNYTEIKFQTAF